MQQLRSRIFYGVILGLLLVAGVALRVASFAWNTRLQGDVSLFALTARSTCSTIACIIP